MLVVLCAGAGGSTNRECGAFSFDKNRYEHDEGEAAHIVCFKSPRTPPR